MSADLIIQPDVYLLGLRIQDPINVLTDIILGLVSFYAYFKLKKSDDRANNLMKYNFLVLALGAILGGIVGHAFIYGLNNQWRLLGWFLTLISILMLEFAALEYSKTHLNPLGVKLISAFIFIEFTAVTALTINFVDFKYVTIHSTIGIILVFTPLHLITYLKTKNKGAKYMMYSVLVLISTLLVFKIPIVIHEYFNHKDLAHIITCASVILMYKGSKFYNNAKSISSSLSK